MSDGKGFVDGVDVREPRGIPRLGQKLRRVQGNDDHRAQNGDDADHDQKLDKGETAALFVFCCLAVAHGETEEELAGRPFNL